jgi:hypothetical protein
MHIVSATKSLLVGLAFALALTFIVQAQGSLIGFVDIPYQGQTVAATSFYVAGWIVDCGSSIPPDVSVGLWNYDTQTWWFPD